MGNIYHKKAECYLETHPVGFRCQVSEFDASDGGTNYNGVLELTAKECGRFVFRKDETGETFTITPLQFGMLSTIASVAEPPNNKKEQALSYGKENVLTALKRVRHHTDDALAQMEYEKPFAGFEKLWAIVCTVAMFAERGTLLPCNLHDSCNE